GTLTSFNGTTGNFTYTPTLTKFGADFFTFRAQDAQGGLGQEDTVFVRIIPRLDPGDILVLDRYLVRLYDPATAQDTIITAGQGLAAGGVNLAYRNGTSIFMFDRSANGLIKANPLTGNQSPVAPLASFSTGPLGAPMGLLINNTGKIIVANPMPSSNILSVDSTTGATTVLFSGGNLGFPTGVVYLANGDLLVTDATLFLGGASKVIRITPAGVQSVVTSGGFLTLPLDLALIDQNTLVIADGGSFASQPDRIIKVNLTTGVQTVLSIGGNLFLPSGLDYRLNKLYVVNNAPTRKVLDIDPVSGVQTILPGSQLTEPWGLLIVPDPCTAGTWIGTANTDWFNAANWSCNTLPTATTDVTIPAGTPFQPVIGSPGTAQVRNLSILTGATLTNNSTLNINGGGAVTTAGIYKGSGTFTGAVYNNTGGIVSPGLSPGCTVFGAGYTNGTGTEVIEIGGTTVCTQYDQLQVVGTATLSGTLDVQLFGGFIPSCGQSFKIMTSTTLVGTFASILYPALPAGLSWGIQYNLPNPGDVTLNILGTPTATATPASQTTCSGTAITNIVLSGSPIAATTYNWTRDNPIVTGIAASGSGDISGTLTNLTNIPITVTFTITPTSGTCVGASITATVTVNPTPDVNQPANQVVCNGAPTAAVTFTGSVTTPPGTVFNWTNSDPSIGLAASGAGNIASFIATNATAAPVVSTVTVTPSYSSGGGPAVPVTFSNTTPILIPAGQPGTDSGPSTPYPSNIVVSGITGAVTNVTVKLNNINHTFPRDIDVLLVGPGGQNAIIMSDIGGGSPGVTGITLTLDDAAVSPLPFSTAIVTGTFQPTNNGTGDVFNAPAPAPLGGSALSVFNGAIANGTWSLYVMDDLVGDFGNFNGGWEITVTGSATGVTCTGTPRTFTYTVNPTPTAVATPASQTRCSGVAIAPIVITGNAVAGVVYNWTRDNTGTVTGIAASGAGNISGTLTNTLNTPVTVTFTITPMANGCPGTPVTATVLVNPTPNAVAAPASQTICSGATITTIALSGNVAGAVYNWTRDNAATVTGIAASGAGNISGALTNTTTTPITVTFTITPTANGCPGTAITATVLVNPTPTAVATPASQTVCSATPITTIVITGNAVAGVVYNWTRDNTGTVTGIAASGAGDISGTLTNTTNAPITVTFTITPTANGCSGTPVTATVTVNPTPDVNQPANQVVCNGAPTAPVTFTGAVAGTVFNWTNSDPTIGLAASGTGDIASFTATNAGTTPKVATVTVTPSTVGSPIPEILYYKFDGSGITVPNLASAPPAGTATATINGAMSQGAPGLCGSGSLIASGGSGTTDYVSTGWNTSLGAGAWTISFKLANVNTATGSALYLFGDPAAGSFRCFHNGIAGPGNLVLRGPVNDVQINGAAVAAAHTSTFVYDPVVGNIKAYLDGVLSNTVAQGAVNISGTDFRVGTWGTSAGFLAGGQMDEFKIFNRALSPAEVSTLVSCSGGTTCTGPSKTFTYTVNPTPNATATPAAQTICSGSAITTIVNSGTVPGTVFNWTRDNPIVTGIAASGAGDISGTLTNLTNTPITVTFTITPSYTNAGVTCTGTPITATVLINPIPDVNQPANQVVCNGAPTAPVIFTGSVTAPPGTVFNWVNSDPSIGLAASGVGNIASFNAINAGTAPVTATVTVTPSYTNGGGGPGSATFNFTGGMQTFTVPAGVTSINITALGAQGGTGAIGGNSVLGGAGGLGASATGTLAVVPGQVLNIFVGGQGASPAGGFNGGANGGSVNAGGGGGASDVRAGGVGVANRVITAGGGGGGGRGGCHEGGGTGGIGGDGGIG
ncbi:MAG: PKD-like domain-containing protein, partial [Ferruginibacter sp.]